MSHSLARRASPCARLLARLLGGGLLPLLSIHAHAADSAAVTPAAGGDAPAATSAPGAGTQATSAVLPTVSVTAQGEAPPPTDPNLPATVESVTRDQFQRWNVVNSEDALKYMPNLAVRKRFIGDQNSIIAVRGTSNSQSARGLVYADGLLLSNLLGNSFTYPPRWSMVAPDEIDRVDVIYGPYSAL